MDIFGLTIKRSNGTDVKNQELETGRRRKSASQRHALRQKFEQLEDMRTLRLAVQNSDNIVNYNRYDLHQIYRRAMKDPVISAQWNTRVLKTLDKEFHVTAIDSTEPDKSAMKIFQAPWFAQWVRKALEVHLWGFSLIEFGIWDDDKRCFKPYLDTTGRYHDAVEVVDRDYVKPEFGMIVPHYGDGKDKGYSYLTSRASERLMFIGSPCKEDTILYKAAGYMLLKENAIANWSEWIEVFAMDMRVGKTETTGTERSDFITILKNMGSNGYAVIDPEDVIEYIGVNRQDAYEVFQRFLQYVDEKISELIFGQSVVTNNTGRVVGKVGEEVSNLYGDSDAKYVQWLINTYLIPYMNMAGAELDGYRFVYDTTEKVKLLDKAKIDKMVADMGYQLTEEYLERTYGVKIEEYIGVPYTGVKQEEE